MSKLLKLVQIGKRELQLSDESYRDLLEEVTGQRSSRGLQTWCKACQLEYKNSRKAA